MDRINRIYRIAKGFAKALKRTRRRMLRDGPPHHIKNLLLHAVPALNGTAVRTIPIRIVNEVFELLRVNCHDFLRFWFG